jgi:hypothetical protein
MIDLFYRKPRMNRTIPLLLLATVAACGGSSTPAAKGPVDEDSNPIPTTDAPQAGVDGGEATASADNGGGGNGAPAPGSSDDSASGGAKKDECNVFDEPNLEGVLLKSSCEVPTPTGSPPDTSKTLEVKVSVNPPKVAPGGHADVVVSFHNKSAATMPLYFTIDPMPRFEIEVYDKKGNRVDLPKNPPPPLPAGMPPREPGEPKTARINLAANGTARMPLSWEAVKMKWAPEKLKGTPPEKGYPRSAAGPLPKGKYSIKVHTPLTNVFEGVDYEVSRPIVQVDVGK